MKLYAAKDYDDMSRKAANILSAQVIMKPHCVLGLATGSTPEGVYKQLIEWYNKGDIDFSEVKSVNLDEYKGLYPSDPQSYHYYMKEKFFNHINIREENTYLPNGVAEDVEAECKRYNEVITSLGGVDLQLLGIGTNGHIGFNEPKEAFERETHCVALTKETIEANARFFENEEDVPKYAISMGIKSIMQAKKIVLVASGSAKAEALYQTFYGPITPAVPSSILQLHNDVTVVADEAALAKIKARKE